MAEQTREALASQDPCTALDGILYVAEPYLGGANKVSISIGAIACSLGVFGQAVASRSGRLAIKAGKPIFTVSEEDAMSWQCLEITRGGCGSAALPP